MKTDVSSAYPAVARKIPPVPENPLVEQTESGWNATLRLGFQQSLHARTVLMERRHSGPLRIQRTFHPEGNVCHAYILHPPGGVVGGDRLVIDAQVDRGAHALVTTPAAGKFYRSAGAWSRQMQRVDVAPGACCEWLPGMNILHGGAKVHFNQHFSVAPTARLLAWDMQALGRSGSGDAFLSGACSNHAQFTIQGVPEWIDRWHLQGSTPVMARPWGLQGFGYTATLLAWPGTVAEVELLRESLPVIPEQPFAVTHLPVRREVQSQLKEMAEPGLLVCRWMSVDGESLGKSLQEAWALLRPRVAGRPAMPPRVWST